MIAPFYDRTWLIDRTLRTVFTNLVEGAALVTLVLLLFLGNLRAAFIVALVIPLSLLATFLGLTWVGIPANLLSLGAMDFGIIVDGAVIVVENVFRKLSEEAHDRTPRIQKILAATVEVGRPTLFSMLIIIAAHIPIFTLQRHEGRIFAPMAWSVTSALIGSLILSLTLVPLLCVWLLRKNLPEGENALVHACKRVYEPVLAWAINNKKKVLATALIALAASLAAVPKLGTEFLPELNEGSIWINVNLPTSVSVTETQRMAGRFRSALASVPEVESVISKCGRPEDGTDPKPINMCEILVTLKPESQWRGGGSKRQLIDEMDKSMSRFPGIEPSFSQPIRDNVLESISQIDGQIVIKVFGEDLDVLRNQAEQVLSAVKNVRGVKRAFVDRLGELPQLLIRVDRDAAARYGLNVADIQDVIEMVLGGKAATQLWEGAPLRRLRAPRRPAAHRLQLALDHGEHRRRRVRADLASGGVQHHRGRDEHRARERRARAFDRHFHRRAGHGQRGVRHEGPRRRADQAPARLQHHLVRGVREPGARHGAPFHHHPGVGTADLYPALRCVRRIPQCASDPAQHPFCADRWNLRADHHRDPVVGFGGDRLYCSLWPGGAERRGHGCVFQPAA